MFSIDVSDYICFMRDRFLKNEPAQYDNSSRVITKNGIMVKVLLRMVKVLLRMDGNNFHRSTFLWVMMCGHTTVFMAHGENEMPECSEFKNVSNHDSCWRSEIQSYINKIYFQFANEIKVYKRPIDMDSRCFLSFSEVKEVFIKYKNNDDYFNDLVGVENRDS